MRRSRHLVPVVVTAALVAGLALMARGPAGAEGTASTQRQIASAFRELRVLPSVSKGAAFLQGYDAPMRTALEQAGARRTSGIDKAVTVRFQTGPAALTGSTEASVPLTISVRAADPPPSFGDSFRAAALKVDGRWKVSWTTMCLMVESSGQLCPPTPPDLVPGEIVPTTGRTASATSTAATPGLVGPGPLAIAPDGGVLIADDDRNEVLEWHDGTLTVVAGDGLEGFSGDGGPATDAELDSPGAIAVAPNGTIDVVDRANDRVRAINPDGTITTVAGDGTVGPANEMAAGMDGRPATSVPLQPLGIAVSPAGTLYVGSNSDIVAVSPDGILSTVVAGGPPTGVDIDAGGTPTAFSPSALAFDGQGSLVVYSSSPKELFSVNPADGHVALIGQNYATALAPAPDGSVLIAEHGGTPERVSGATTTEIPLTDPSVGANAPLVADGIAEAGNGTLYVDTGSGDGFNVQANLYEVTAGTVQPVQVTTPELESLPVPGAPGFPASTFPLSTPSRDPNIALPACPSPVGLVPFTPSAKADASTLLGGWNTTFSYDLHASDRSWWTGLIAASVGGRQNIGVIGPAAGTLYAPAIAAACGPKLVDDSISVVMARSVYSAAVEHLYLLDRGGTPLVYFSAS